MTASAAPARRPSPHPRPDDGQPRPAAAPHLRVVPEPTLQSETAIGDTLPPVGVPAGQNVADHATSAPISEPGSRIARVWGVSKAYWTPPAIFTDQAPALTDVAAYAKTAPWTHQHTGPIRKLGVAYGTGFAVPYTVWSRYKEHVVQRPGRLAAHLGLFKLFALTGPGIWLVDHLIYPAARIVGHLFL